MNTSNPSSERCSTPTIAEKVVLRFRGIDGTDYLTLWERSLPQNEILPPAPFATFAGPISGPEVNVDMVS